MGAGKSYVLVNRFMVDYLRDTNRPIYTNLPINLDAFLAFAAGGKPSLIEAYRERVTIAEHGKAHALDEQGQPILDASTGQPRQFDRVKEFWRFTEPNSVIILDETADAFNSQAWKERPEELQSYINHHRHYKDDIFLCCQDRDDVDVQIRRKVQYVWLVSNSLTENISEHRLFLGMKWPLQFFMVRCFSGPQVMGKNAAATSRVAPINPTMIVWPRQGGFRNYQSFSASTSLPGKKMSKEGQKSGDVGQGLTSQWGAFFGRIPAMLAGLVGLVGLVVAVAFMARVYFQNLKSEIGGVQSENVATNIVGGVTNAPSVPGVASNRERLVAAFPDRVVSNLREYRRGDSLGGRGIRAIGWDGVLWDDGTGSPWSVVFPGR
jgi:hypothetical protein